MPFGSFQIFKPLVTSTSKRNSRFLLILIGLLLCSNLATALVAYLVIDRIDTQYSEELRNKVPGLHEVMVLAQEATNTHRAAGNLLLARDEKEKTELLARVAAAQQAEWHSLAKVFGAGPGEADAERASLWQAANDYKAAVGQFLVLINRGDRDAALAYRLDQLRPAFDQYQRRQREESVRLNFAAIKAGGEISASVTARKGVLLGFGSWPFLVMLAMLVVFGILGGILWRQLRRIEADERELRPEQRF